ncbi:MAG: adenosylcobinamide-phosphate synthase CbiB [Meiothermus sp.]|uniref:adenosylcobinamide-phosphate synthase CbiB n=1 Tax=Meiothermus sp. TaxID=1955249 RepID=UPI0025FFAA65|nr:adenosylcobinamide-phosphate synthase CbiB [Meiothermus sp.]MCS7068189.1 adenosylcobinamide-phosphate synthase CbiB [Meiothermus sp.]MDW8426215.1 adenosylcobinamide-phosphate synthase CbiB [Meiothermus sp.]
MSILLALLMDWRLGEPPAPWHPVVWMGRYLSWAGRGLTALAPRKAFWAGALAWMLGALLWVGAYALLAWLLDGLPAWLELPLTALLLKPLLAFRLLLSEARAVEEALGEGLEAGRARLSHLVSRNTSQLSESEVRESLLESASENLSDSVIAPLFWFVLLGLPGAALYRFANTADAMWGYRGRWEWAGKWAARADDLLNLLPARLTALLLWAVAPRFRGWRLLHEARKTPSPNSGWPMAALALGLGLRLGKPGVYTLNPSGRAPNSSDVQAGLILVSRAGWLGVLLLATIEAGLYFLQSLQ